MPFLNRVRLPFYLSRPQFPVDEEIYLKSNGRRVVQKSIVSKEMQGATDYMPALLHERMAIALRHDVVNVEGDKYTGSIRVNGAYEIGWIDFLNYPTAPAAFKAFEEAFAARSNRCDICEETNVLSLRDDVIPGTMSEGEVYQVNVAANDSICCSDPVFSIFSYDTDYIDTISISSAGLVTLTLKAPVDSVANKDLFVYKVTCNNQEATATVKGTIEGSGSPLCEAPSGLELSLVSSTEIHAEWTAPSGGAPADGYEWLLTSDDGITETTVSFGTTTDTFVNINSLDCETLYRFRVRALCEEDVDESADIMATITTPDCGSPLLPMSLVAAPFAVANGGNEDWKVQINIVFPGGVTLDENILITGVLRIYDSTLLEIPYNMTLLAGNTHAETGVLATTDPGLDADLTQPSANPPFATGSDANEYDLIISV